jgi:hypothetical protein
VDALNVRRLAAIDMHGLSGTAKRRRIILIEFLTGALVCTALGLWQVLVTDSIGWRIFALWLIGIGCNYVPLAWHALSLRHPQALRSELAGVPIADELRRYTARQLWIFVPFVLVLFALQQRQ